MSDLKRDIEDVRWALKAFEPEERKRNADMMRYTYGTGRPVNTKSSFERIVEALESRTNFACKKK